MSFVHSDKEIHSVMSADEILGPQESPTNFENPHFAITNTTEMFENHIYRITSIMKLHMIA